MTDLDRSQISIDELRKFGLIFGGLVAVLFGLLIPVLTASLWQKLWPWYLGGGFILLAIVFPAGLKPIYRAWMTFGDVAGWLNTRVILLLLFYVVVLPVGLIMKIFGSDPLHRKADPSMESYRITATAVDKKHMERPY